MPRATRSYGRVGTRVFPPGWGASHAAVVEDTYECTVVIRPPSTGTEWSTELGRPVPVLAEPSYTGPASVGYVSDTATRLDVVGEDATVTRYEVKLIRETTGVAPGHRVLVSVSPDGALEGRTLMVDRVLAGDRRFSRVLHAELED